VARGLGMMLMLNVPATVGLFVLATPIVKLLFERGHFLPADTAATAAAAQLYALGLAGYSAVRIASPTFYAIGDSRVPAVVSAGAIAVNIVASVALVRSIGFAGLALGTSLASIANGAALVWLLRRRLGRLDGRRLVTTFVKAAASSAVMAMAALAIQREMERVVPGSGLFAQVLRLGASIGGGLVALGFTAMLLRVEEFADACAVILGRVQKLLRR
jgi:putative peptidoglycan lipid II flippase